MTDLADSPTVILAIFVELPLLLMGGALLWRLALSPTARAQRGVELMSAWSLPPAEFALIVWSVFMTGFVVQSMVFQLARWSGWSEDGMMVAVHAGFGGGGLLALACIRFRTSVGRDLAMPRSRFMIAGLATFLVALPLVQAAVWVWLPLLDALGLPSEPQEAVQLFTRVDSPALRTAMILLLVVLAPVLEEWIFRGVLFRYACGRLPRWGALVLPAMLWASLHGLTAFAPLFALGVVLSLAYQRTGNLAVPMLAHALFNLHTLLHMLSGVGGEG